MGRWFFPEPTEPDDTPGRQGESRADFLARSTWDRAAETRAFYNHALAALPASCAKALYRRFLADETAATTFEMVVGRFLQLRGAKVLECEPAREGARPDWRATFRDGTVHVEATVPVYNASAGKEMARRERLLQVLEERAPDGWWLHAFAMPDIDGAVSLKPFKAEVDRLLATAPPTDATMPGEQVELRGQVYDQRLELSLWRTGMKGGVSAYGVERR